MKHYHRSEINSLRKKLAYVEKLEPKMDSIELDFARYDLSTAYDDLARIFIYPHETGEFTPAQIVQIKRAIEWAFGFTDQPVPANTASYQQNKFKWQREFRESEGRFYITRKIRPDIKELEILFVIERAPKLNCRIEQHEVTRTEYKAVCD